jgi:hypothetical protein
MIAVVCIALLCVLAYHFYFRPKWERQRYITVLQDLGYKVYAYPFELTSNSLIRSGKQFIEEKGDICYPQKH